MDISIWALCASALTIGLIHTISGPDHYLPLIVFSRARKWNAWQTAGWTALCAIGHVLGSVAVGMAGVFLGWELSKQNWQMDIRGSLSGWALLIFGFVYLLWGIRKAIRGTPHKHFEVTGQGDIHAYKHTHTHAYLHDHDDEQYHRGTYNSQTRQHHPPPTHAHTHDVPARGRMAVTPWILFVIFVMAPLEPLMPFLFVSGARQSWPAVLAVVLTFIMAKMLVMESMVLLGYFGLGFARFKTQKLERFSSLIAGAVVTFCGIGVVFLGW